MNTLREQFERTRRDSFGFRRSRKGNYVNPQIARDWRNFCAGYVRGMNEAARHCDELQAVPATEPRHCAEDLRLKLQEQGLP